jgi:hypothetical protein
MTVHHMPTARTVSNAKLQGLHIVRCDCHNMIRCPSLDTLARIHEGQNVDLGDPIGDAGKEAEFQVIRWVIAFIAVVVIVALSAQGSL